MKRFVGIVLIVAGAFMILFSSISLTKNQLATDIFNLGPSTGAIFLLLGFGLLVWFKYFQKKSRH